MQPYPEAAVDCHSWTLSSSSKSQHLASSNRRSCRIVHGKTAWLELLRCESSASWQPVSAWPSASAWMRMYSFFSLLQAQRGGEKQMPNWNTRAFNGACRCMPAYTYTYEIKLPHIMLNSKQYFQIMNPHSVWHDNRKRTNPTLSKRMHACMSLLLTSVTLSTRWT